MKGNFVICEAKILYFSKYVRSTKCTAGQAAVQKTWIWAKQMESFRPYISFAKTSSNVSGIEPSLFPESSQSHMDDESNEELMNQSTVFMPAVDAEMCNCPFFCRYLLKKLK